MSRSDWTAGRVETRVVFNCGHTTRTFSGSQGQDWKSLVVPLGLR